MTDEAKPQPTLDDLKREFPLWRFYQGTEHYYAELPTQLVKGTNPTELRTAIMQQRDLLFLT